MRSGLQVNTFIRLTVGGQPTYNPRRQREHPEDVKTMSDAGEFIT